MRFTGRKLYKVLLGAIFALIISSFSAKTYALDIGQQDLVVSAHSSSLTIHNNGIGSTDFQITPQLEFNKLGDFITYKLTLHNNDGKKYKIASVKDDNANDAIELTYAYPTDLDVNDKSLELTIKYVKKSSTPLQTITATISLVDEDDISQQITIVVPNTGTNTITDTRSATIRNTIIIYGAFAGTIVTIYIIIRRKQKANKRSTKLPKILVAATLLLGFIPVAVIAATAKDLQFIIEFNNVVFNGPYTVNFDANGGTPVPNTKTINHGETVARPTDPNKTGYTFSKWMNGANEYDFTAPATSNLDLTAEYNVINYNITYELNGGTVATPNPTTYNIESSDIVLNNPTKGDHAFKGWVTGGGQTPELTVTIPQGSTGDKSYEAIFNPIYTVTYDANGGDAISPNTFSVENGEEIGNLATPTREHYDFSGWYVGSTKVESDYVITDNTTIVAKWTPKTYTITYNLNGGTVATNNPTTYTIETPDFTLNNPTPSSTNKVFAGWTGTNGTTPETTVTITQGSTGDRAYEAVYKNYYTVTFSVGASNDTPPADRTILDGEKIGALPAGPKPIEFVIYEFDGWYVGDTKIDANYVITGDTTVVAKYAKKTITNGVEDLVDEDVTDPSCVTNNQVGLVVSDDPDGNARYIGSCPSNYVYYNCASDPTGDENYDYASSCDLYRIVGVFNVDDGTGKIEKRTKIIRDTGLKNTSGGYTKVSFDLQSGNNPRASSQWGPSTYNGNTYNGAYLQRVLNNHFYGKTEINPSWYYGYDYSYGSSKFNSEQALSDYAKTLIGDAVWHTGAVNSDTSYTPKQFYQAERGTARPTPGNNRPSRTTQWIGKVGLLYPSDYMYSPSDNAQINRVSCLGSSWNNGAKCFVSSWLVDGVPSSNGYFEWFITPDTKAPESVWYYNKTINQNPGDPGQGYPRGIQIVTSPHNDPSATSIIRPVMYLKADVKILSGTGEKTNPFRIGFSNE